MKKLSIIGFLLLLLFQTACREEFGKTLFGPDKTVAPEILTDRELVFVNTTETSDISSAREMTLDPVDVIFSSIQPIGYTKEVTVSAKLRDGKIASDNVFYLNVLKDEAVLDAFKTHVGYKAEFLPEAAYKLENDMVVFERDGKVAVNSCTIRIINSFSLEINKDYVLAIQLEATTGFHISETNKVVYLHVKRKGGSGEMEGAADFRPMAGDNTLDANGVDKGVNRNNLYYEADGSSFKNLQACTIEGLIYVDSFKAESERSEGTLAGISSLWGCEDNGGTVNFLLRFGDAGVSTNMLQLIVNDKKYIINYKFKEKQWYHIAMTYDGADIKFYINYRERLSISSTGNISLAGSSFRLGQSFNQWRGFNGKMSEVRIWKTSRTIKELKDNALDVIQFDLEKSKMLAYWKMNKVMLGSGNQKISDVSGNGCHLTVKRQGATDESVTPVVVIDNDIDINV